MNAPEDITYRLALADGFLAEAEQDWQIERWRSCVDNAQLAAENAGKAVLVAFGVTPKTHDPVNQVASLLSSHGLSVEMAEIMRGMLPDLMALGSAEHFMTDYGDEDQRTLPWDLFKQESAEDALTAARHAFESAKALLALWEDEE